MTVMTQKEAAKYLRLSQSYLSRMTTTGDIPHKKVGSKPLYVQEILDSWLVGKQQEDDGVRESV
jgi:excisionase family DNA binding protein